jgi:hypothetical protein
MKSKLRSMAVRASTGLVLAAGLCVAPRPAHALETFPGIIQKKYQDTLDCPPPCTICHTSPSGGSDTAVQPFVINLLMWGSLAESTLPGYLDAVDTKPCMNTEDPGCKPDAMGMCTGQCDADGNGTADVAQLKSGTNPNTGEKLFCVTYGCGASRVAPKPAHQSVDGTFALAMLGGVVVIAGRLRRKSKR